RTRSGSPAASRPPVTRYQVSASSPANGKATVPSRASTGATLRLPSCPHLPLLPQPLASGPPTVESARTLIPATRTRRRERALSEAEAYERCHGQRALSLVRMPVAPNRDERLRTALKRALEE